MENVSGFAIADISSQGEKWALPCRPEPRDGKSFIGFDCATHWVATKVATIVGAPATLRMT
eukprot:scaffold1666_cov424-Prasinococcus_capsulatus_cf.AAC.15